MKLPWNRLFGGGDSRQRQDSTSTPGDAQTPQNWNWLGLPRRRQTGGNARPVRLPTATTVPQLPALPAYAPLTLPVTPVTTTPAPAGPVLSSIHPTPRQIAAWPQTIDTGDAQQTSRIVQSGIDVVWASMKGLKRRTADPVQITRALLPTAQALVEVLPRLPNRTDRSNVMRWLDAFQALGRTQMGGARRLDTLELQAPVWQALVGQLPQLRGDRTTQFSVLQGVSRETYLGPDLRPPEHPLNALLQPTLDQLCAVAAQTAEGQPVLGENTHAMARELIRRLSGGTLDPNAIPAIAVPTKPINLHGMWYRRDLHLPGGRGSEQFRTQLMEAYLEFSRLAPSLPSNVQTHLWTDRKSPHALFMPVLGPQGTVIDVPHSQILRDLVQVHSREELEAMIDRQADPGVRKALRELFAAPLGANIGMRADLERALYGYLPAPGAAETKLNLHIDVDTLCGTRELVRAKEVLGEPPDPDEFLGSQITEGKPDIERHAIKRRALARDVANLNLPPAPARDLSHEDIAQLLSKPRPKKKARPAEKPPVVVPDAIKQAGYAVHSGDNDYFAMVPQSGKAASIMEMTRALLRRTNEPLDAALGDLPASEDLKFIVNLLEQESRERLRHLARFNGRAGSDELTPQEQVDYFRLACRIVAARPLVDERIDRLASSAQGAEVAEAEIRCLKTIRSLCGHTVVQVVNCRSYPPQYYAHNDKPPEEQAALREALAGFSTELFGRATHSAHSGSWQAPNGNPSNSELEADRIALTAAMKTITSLLAANEAESREGDPQRLR